MNFCWMLFESKTQSNYFVSVCSLIKKISLFYNPWGVPGGVDTFHFAFLSLARHLKSVWGITGKKIAQEATLLFAKRCLLSVSFINLLFYIREVNILPRRNTRETCLHMHYALNYSCHIIRCTRRWPSQRDRYSSKTHVSLVSETRYVPFLDGASRVLFISQL